MLTPTHEPAQRLQIKLDRDELAVAILSYAEIARGVVIPSEKVGFSLLCYADDAGQIESVDAVFFKPTPIEGIEPCSSK